VVWVTDDLRLARRTPVAAVQQLLAIEPLLVGPDEDLLVVMRRCAQHPETRLLGVVDADRRLVGVVPILRVAEAVVARAVPEALLVDISDVSDVARFGHLVEARTVADVMLPPAVTHPEATIAEAFREMHRRHLSGLYVVDSDGRPTGYIDLLELAMRYVDVFDRAAGGAHES
jgi:CBS domain-containing protein